MHLGIRTYIKRTRNSRSLKTCRACKIGRSNQLPSTKLVNLRFPDTPLAGEPRRGSNPTNYTVTSERAERSGRSRGEEKFANPMTPTSSHPVTVAQLESQH